MINLPTEATLQQANALKFDGKGSKRKGDEVLQLICRGQRHIERDSIRE